MIFAGLTQNHNNPGSKKNRPLVPVEIHRDILWSSLVRFISYQIDVRGPRPTGTKDHHFSSGFRVWSLVPVRNTNRN